MVALGCIGRTEIQFRVKVICLTNKQPPNSLEAEKSVLGSILLDNESIVTVASTIGPESFYHPDMKVIYESMTALYNKSRSIDVVTLCDSLKSSGSFDNVGGFEIIKELSIAVPTSSNVKDYAQIVKRTAYERAVIKQCEQAINCAYADDLDSMLETLGSMPSARLGKKKHKKTSDILQKMVLNDVIKRSKQEDDMRGLTTGFPDLDAKTGGMKKGEVIGIKAGPNIGKSLLAMDIARHNAKKGKEVAIFAYEMTTQNIGYRLAPTVFDVKIDKLTNPKNKLGQEDVGVIKSNIERLKRDNYVDRIQIYADELEMNTVEEIAGHLKLLHKIDLVFVDYLQLLEGAKSDFSMDVYTVNLRKLKKLAKSLSIPIVVILGETKNGEIRGTNEVEHDLDQLYEIDREKFGKTKEIREQARLLTKKGRNGRLGITPLKYSEDYLTFRPR